VFRVFRLSATGAQRSGEPTTHHKRPSYGASLSTRRKLGDGLRMGGADGAPGPRDSDMADQARRTRIWRTRPAGLGYGGPGPQDSDTADQARRTRIRRIRPAGLGYGGSGPQDSDTADQAPQTRPAGLGYKVEDGGLVTMPWKHVSRSHEPAEHQTRSLHSRTDSESTSAWAASLARTHSADVGIGSTLSESSEFRPGPGPGARKSALHRASLLAALASS
jgi:hypothetical protein